MIENPREEYARVTRDVFGAPEIHLPIELFHQGASYRLVFDGHFVTSEQEEMLRELMALRNELNAALCGDGGER